YVELRDLRFGGTEKYAFALSFTNKGIGPASIEFFDIKLDGERPTDLADLIRKSADIPDRPFGISNNFARVLSPGEKVDLVEVTTEVVSELYRANEDIDIEAETAFYRQLVDGFTDAYRSGRIELTYCYCSVFEDCWQGSNLIPKPVPVDICPKPVTPESIETPDD
ncbi:MAG: hypothetical protein AAGK23_13620, partial [Pseudomonadota bacterium]